MKDGVIKIKPNHFTFVCEIPFKNATMQWFDGKLYAFFPDHPPHYLDIVEKKFKPVEPKKGC